MQQIQIAQEIKKMKPAQRLSLVQEIWDSIALDRAQVPFPDWQKNELKARHEEYKNGMLSLHDWTDVHQRLRNKVK
ncbi:MAG: addiction module protein [Desulfonatronovibrio sp.]